MHARDHDHDTLVARYAKVDQVVRNKWATLDAPAVDTSESTAALSLPTPEGTKASADI